VNSHYLFIPFTSLALAAWPCLRALKHRQEKRRQEALDAGAFEVGDRNLVDQIANGHPIYLQESAIATPDMVPEITKIKKHLGVNGLFPSEKQGIVEALYFEFPNLTCLLLFFSLLFLFCVARNGYGGPRCRDQVPCGIFPLQDRSCQGDQRASWETQPPRRASKSQPRVIFETYS